MYVGIIYDPDTNRVADYGPDARLMRYTISDGDYLKDGSADIHNAQICLSFYKEEDKYTKLMSVMICGAIGGGAARAMEEYGAKIIRNVSGDIDDVIAAYKDKGLEDGENTKLPDRQNLLEYWCAVQHRGIDIAPEYFAKGLELYGGSLTDKDKLWLYDQCFSVPSRKHMLPNVGEVLDYKFDLKCARKYMNSFMKVWTTYKTERNADPLDEQEYMLSSFKVLAENIEDGSRQVFLDEALIRAAKDRLILIAEYLMDQKADINYTDKKGQSVEKFESAMQDITMRSYLSHYRKNGVKSGPALAYFISREKHTALEDTKEAEKAGKRILTYNYKYLPKYADPDGQIFGKLALSFCKEILKEYSKTDILKKTTKAEVLDAFVDEYNWDDGLEVPHFIAVHPNCSRETKEKIFDLADGSFYGTKDFEESDDEQWKALVTELYEMLNG